MLLKRWSPVPSEVLEVKLEAVGYGFFIPIFFAYSGMTLDVDSIASNPAPLIIFFALLLIRGAPALFWYRRDFELRERIELAFFSATALPLLVALTEIGVSNGQMTIATQASIIGAGALSVLVFPIAAVLVSNNMSLSGAGRARAPRVQPVPAEK
ncbi:MULTISPECIES: cation:proton antiporter [Subtercola]|nr:MULTISPECIES: cation:proton antiporter [Subtercola]MEA9985286.1 cation:proton antiporter [Subtercola sp. RTI3]